MFIKTTSPTLATTRAQFKARVPIQRRHSCKQLATETRRAPMVAVLIRISLAVQILTAEIPAISETHFAKTEMSIKHIKLTPATTQAQPHHTVRTTQQLSCRQPVPATRLALMEAAIILAP